MKIGTNEDFEIIEPGTYPAKMIEWSDTDQFGKPLMSKGFADKGPQPQWRCKFALDVPYQEDRQLSAWINQPGDMENVSPRAKIVELAKACLGDEADTTDWDVPDLLDRPLRVQVEIYQNGEGQDRNKISKFYPPAKKRTAPAPPTDEDEAPPPPPLRQREAVGAGARAKPPF